MKVKLRLSIRQIILLALTVTPIVLLSLSELLFQLYNRSFWKTYTSSNSELAGNLVEDILIVGDNIWLGTNEGLNLVRPDGSWETYTTANSGLLSNDIGALGVDGSNNIWIAHSDGLSVLPANGNWITYPKSFFSEDQIFYINAVAIDRLNRAWVGSTDGLFVLNQNEPPIIYTENNSGLVHNSVWALNIDKFDKVWIGTREGLSGYDLNHSKWITYTEQSKTWILSIFIDQHQQIWVGTDMDGVAVRASNDTWHSYTPWNSVLVDNTVRSIVVDEQDRVWLGTMRGLNVFEVNNNLWRSYAVMESGLPDNLVRKLAIDHQNRLWVGTVSGVSVLDLHKELPVPPPKKWTNLRSSTIRFIQFEGWLLLVLGYGSLPYPCLFGPVTLLMMLAGMTLIYTMSATWWALFIGASWNRIMKLSVILLLSLVCIGVIHYVSLELISSVKWSD